MTLAGTTYSGTTTVHVFFQENGGGSGEDYYNVVGVEAPLGTGTVTWVYTDSTGATVSDQPMAPDGTTVTFTETPASASDVFQQWSDDASGTSSTANVTINANDILATANYIPSATAFQIDVVFHGSTTDGEVLVDINGVGQFTYTGAFWVLPTDTVEFEAVEDQDDFDHWSVSGVASYNMTLAGTTYTGTTTVHVFFQEGGGGSGDDYYNVVGDDNPSGAGSVTWEYTDSAGTVVSMPTSGMAPDGATVTFTEAPASAAWVFQQWSDDASGTASTANVTIAGADILATANYIASATAFQINVVFHGSTTDGEVLVDINGVGQFTYTGAF
jgi:hypothetical protein